MVFLVKAIYLDGNSEPEVYVDREEWDTFDASDFRVAYYSLEIIHLIGIFG